MKRFNKFRVLYASVFALVLLALSSCATPYNVAYFQDMPIEQEVTITRPQSVVLKAGDEISILVSTRDAALSSLFSKYSNYNVSSAAGGSSYGVGSSLYIIDAEGYIDFPVLGRIKAAGMTRSELELYIKKMIQDQNLVKEPVVTVTYNNLYVMMIGATGVGRVEIDRDNFTILDAITQAGDLDISGMRENIKVIRSTDIDKRIAYEVNICSAEDLYNSPVYYLQQGDIIYVEPTDKVKRTTTEYGSQLVNYAFWFSLVSSVLTLIAVFR